MMPPPVTIFVDGLPGTGKTSLARWLEDVLQAQGQPARCISESDLQHPLHWFTYHDGDDFIPPNFNSITIPVHIENSLKKWKQFSLAAQSSETTFIIDGYPVLNSAGIFLWGDASRQQCQGYLEDLQGLMAGLRAALIYLRTTDLESALARKLGWLEREGMTGFFMDSMESQPFLQRRGLKGRLGVYALWESVQWALQSFYAAQGRSCRLIDRDNLQEDQVRSEALAFLESSFGL
jgi:hypothetical protein